MKKVIKAIALLHIILLYCLTIGIYSGGRLLSSNSSQHQSANERDYYSVVSPTLLCHTNQTKNILDSIQELSSSLRTNLVDDFLSSWKAKEQLQSNRIANSIDRSKLVDVDFDSTSIIYPFHYFL